MQEHTVTYRTQQSVDINIDMGSNIIVPPVVTEQDTTQQEQTREEESQEETSQEEQEETTGQDETSGQSGNGAGSEEGKAQNSELGKKVKKVILICGISIGSVLALAVIIVLQQKMRRAKRMKSFRKKKDNRGITNIYNAIYEMCMFAGLKKMQETERERLARMAETFLQLTEEEWNWLYLQAEQAAFSGKVFSTNEQKEMYYLYSKLRKELLKAFSWQKRMWFLYGRAM